jgi:hypothetical protein
MSDYPEHWLPGFEEELDDEGPQETLEGPSAGPIGHAGPATRSRADDVIDAVANTGRRVPIRVCPQCGGQNFAIRGGLGETRTRMCKTCRVEIPVASVLDPVVSSLPQQLVEGPFYSPDGPQPRPDPNQPMFRIADARRRK